MMKKEDYMALALKEAEKGMGFVAPNPLVGAVIVKDDRIISKGYHKRFGDLHAERQAIKNADEDISGSTLYVTLEPCCHVGKQPPCTEALIKSGIKKVVVGSLDPNPLVSGKGIALLRKEGLNVEVGILREECDALNERFIFHMTYKQPFVYLKYAMTLDGKIATKTGDSKWISNEHSRQSVQKLRQKCSAIMVGINTVLADNPRLTCRIPKGEALVRIVCDS
ncbi:riboflavin biosynthesis protein RibD [Streptococcus agalactiae]|nr:riboflavin biosynthesis protein RibD [Streptococcus agalactiae]